MIRSSTFIGYVSELCLQKLFTHFFVRSPPAQRLFSPIANKEILPVSGFFLHKEKLPSSWACQKNFLAPWPTKLFRKKFPTKKRNFSKKIPTIKRIQDRPTTTTGDQRPPRPLLQRCSLPHAQPRPHSPRCSLPPSQHCPQPRPHSPRCSLHSK